MKLRYAPPEPIERLEQFLYEFPLDLARTSCVYFLIDRDRVVYVGKTTNLVARINQHLTYRKGLFNRVLFLPVPIDEADETEAILINRLKPELNTHMVKGNRYLSPEDGES